MHFLKRSDMATQFLPANKRYTCINNTAILTNINNRVKYMAEGDSDVISSYRYHIYASCIWYEGKLWEMFVIVTS